MENLAIPGSRTGRVPARPARVLVVEDNDGDIRLVQEALKQIKSSCQLTIAKDGIAALEHLRQSAEQPDLILLDLNLPLKDGREVLQEIKQDHRLMHIPVVILTSSRAPEDVTTAYGMHANCYLSKPSRVNEFFSLLASVEQFWTRLAHLPRLAASE